MSGLRSGESMPRPATGRLRGDAKRLVPLPRPWYGPRMPGNGSNLQTGSSLPQLVSIMQRLLAPGGCPWDREQTLTSLRAYVIEEAYEVVDAIDTGEPEALREELGDLLLQIVFQSELARSRGWFGPDDVIAGICNKLVRRHPHVFGELELSTSDEVVTQWEQIKAQEKRGRGALSGVPGNLPGLLRALRMSEKATRLGLDWPSAAAARQKLNEELGELDAVVTSGEPERIDHELGDALFALANLARKLGRDPELALRGALHRFADRVRTLESLAAERGRAPEAMSAQELDVLWAEAKKRTDAG